MFVEVNPLAEKRGKRKLTAIISADVVGYSRLMEDDEETNVSAIPEYREVIVGSVEKHIGRHIISWDLTLTSDKIHIVRCLISSPPNFGNPTFPYKDHRQNN